MHCELARGLEAWQDQVMLLQWADHRRAEAAVFTQRELRRQKLEVENKERTLLHQQRIRKYVVCFTVDVIRNNIY